MASIVFLVKFRRRTNPAGHSAAFGHPPTMWYPRVSLFKVYHAVVPRCEGSRDVLLTMYVGISPI